MLLGKQKKETNLQLMKGFLRRIIPQVILFCGLCIIFAVVLLLTYQSLSYFWYGAQLALFLLLLSCTVQFYIYKAQLQEVYMRNYLDKDPSQEKDRLLREYQEQAQQLKKEFYSYKQTERDKQKEQMDYFSLWLHQIKTPISAMSVLVQQMEEDSEEKKKLEEELLHLTDYTHLALNYLKLEETGKELEIEEFRLDEVIRTALKKYSILFIYNPIQLDYQTPSTTIESDKKWVQVLVEQILSNSLKYTPEGTIKIYMEQQGLIIEDTGVGISQEELPKIFEKGYTGLNGRLHEKSTGLGLFISRKIANRLDHTLSIESEVGVGTTVRIDFSRRETPLFD